MKNDLKIAVLPGDGIGVDVTNASLPVFKALNIPVQLTFGDIGWRFWQNEGNPLPDRTLQLIKNSDATLLGAITSKPQKEAQQELSNSLDSNNLNYISPIIQLRQKLDLFANIRPCFNLAPDQKPFNFCIIRENTEGLYSGFDFHPTPPEFLDLIKTKALWQDLSAHEIATSLRIQTLPGLTRIFEFAFQYADAHNLQRVTFADKPNVLRQSSDFARRLFESIASKYPKIQADILNVDAVALWLIKRPESFGVIVAENMFADILSDVGAGVMGGLGLAPSANIGDKGCYFEPVHGSAPQLKEHSANPCAMFLSIGMMLAHFGYADEAVRIKQAIINVIAKGSNTTYDLGGKASTLDMAKEIIDFCETQKKPFKQRAEQLMKSTHSQSWEKLKEFTTSELSDALDSCGIEGALLNIKPLTTGQKIIGPAHTIKFAINKKKHEHFQHAASYIDSVAANSVIVIDNGGRGECTAWGEILTQVAQLKKISGTVVYGAVRDVEFIRKVEYPVYCTDTYMRSGKNRIHKVDEQIPILIQSVCINPGDIICADDNGVVVIPIKYVDEICQKAGNIKKTEQNILFAVKNGSTLEDARKKYRYDQPWLENPNS